MRPKKPETTGEGDLFRARLDQIINLKHPLVLLAETIDWQFLDRQFASACAAGPGQPGLPTRLVAGLFILGAAFGVIIYAARHRNTEN